MSCLKVFSLAQVNSRKYCEFFFLNTVAHSFFLLCAEFCQNFKQEIEWIETVLDRIKSLVVDVAAMNVLRLEARLDNVLGYVARLKIALTKIDEELWPEDKLQNDLESPMTRLNEVTS